MTQRHRRMTPARSGTVLVIVMVLLIVTMAIAGAIFRKLLIDSRQFRTDAHAFQADRLAEAGLARARSLAAASDDFRGDTWNVELSDSARGRVVTQIEETANGFVVEAVATYPLAGTHSVRSRRSETLQQSTR